MTEWYPCKWCEGEGGWHAHDEPSYSNPGETIAKLRVELEQARFQAIKEEGNFLYTAVPNITIPFLYSRRTGMTQEAKTENLMTWNGLDVDFWGPRQTLSPKPIEDVWFAG